MRPAKTCVRCAGQFVPGILDDAEPRCRLCVMLATSSPPRIKTEATFQAKAALGGGQFHPAVRDLYLQRAAEAGVTTDGRVYEPRLAAYPGDPEAWISNQDEMVAVAQARNYSISGDVTVKGEFVPPTKRDCPIASDTLEDLMEDRLEEQLGPDFVEAKGAVVERVRDDVLTQHAPPDFYKEV